MALATKERSQELPDSPEDVVETREYHCSGCGRFLFYEAIVWGVVKIKCPNSKCKQWNYIKITPPH